MGWEYRDIAGNEAQLIGRAAGMAQRDLPDAVLLDTRVLHAELYDGLTPAGAAWFAGNYRGASYPGLDDCVVVLPPGCPHPARVAKEMADFSNELAKTLQELQHLASLDGPQPVKSVRGAILCAKTFGDFINIHPYANGNGHIARLLVVVMMARVGCYLPHWVDPQPEPADLYAEASWAAMRGDPLPLAAMIVRAASAS